MQDKRKNFAEINVLSHELIKLLPLHFLTILS